MQTKIIERYFFFGLLSVTFLFAFLIFRPFWVVLVLGASFSIVLRPIYEWFVKEKLPEWLAALVTVLFFIIVLCGPLLGIGTIVFKQSQDFYHVIVGNHTSEPVLVSLEHNINRVLPANMAIDINQKVSEFVSFISGNIALIFSTTFSALFSFVMMLLAIFYFLKDGARWKRAVVVISPLADGNDEKIIERLNQSIKGVMLGYILIGLVQGFLMGIGLAIFHVPNPALWGVTAAIASLIPTIGTSLVSVPAVIYLFLTGHSGAAVGLLVWAVLLVSTIDNFLSPLFLSKRINMPPLLILFSVLGGISLLGPVGVLIGPLTISLLYTLISIYRHEYKETLIS